MSRFGSPLRPLIDAFDMLWKGAGHKYLRRVPTGKVTKSGKPRYRYIYKYTTKAGKPFNGVDVAPSDHVHVGSAFRDAAFGHKGHWVVTSVNRTSGSVRDITVRHDETGEVQSFNSGYSLEAFLHEGHKDALRAEEARREAGIPARYAKHAQAALRTLARAHASGELIDIAQANKSLQWAQRLAAFGLLDFEAQCAAFGVNTELKKTWGAHAKEYRALEAECMNLTLGRVEATGVLTSLIDPDQLRRMMRYQSLRKRYEHGLVRHFGIGWTDEDYRTNPRVVPLADRRLAESLGAAGASSAAQKRAFETWFAYNQPWGGESDKNKETSAAALKRGLIVSLPWGYLDDPESNESKGWVRLIALAERVPAGVALNRRQDGSQDRARSRAESSIRDAMSETGTDGPTPTAYVDGFVPESLSGREIIEKAAVHAYQQTDGTAPRDILNAAALSGTADPVVSRFVRVGRKRGGELKHETVSAPLSRFTAAIATEAKARTDRYREAHKKRYAKAKATFDNVLGRVSAKASRDAVVAELYRLKPGERPPANADVYGIAHHYLRDNPVYADRHEGDDLVSGPGHRLKTGLALFDAVHKDIRARIQTRVLGDIHKALGTDPDVQHALSQVHVATGDAPRKQLERIASANRDKLTDADRMEAYDPAGSDPLQMRQLLGFMDKSVAPKAAIFVLPQAVGAKLGTTRAHCSYDNRIQLYGQNDAITAWHEFGHAIEHASTGITEAANALRDERGKGAKPTKLGELTGAGYEAHELCYPGVPFAESGPYAAKWYGHNASTEVLAMGVQALMHDAADFIAKDPEHAAFTIAALTGKLGTADRNTFKE